MAQMGVAQMGVARADDSSGAEVWRALLDDGLHGHPIQIIKMACNKETEHSKRDGESEL